MTNISPDISVIICAYTEERWDDLLVAVQSVQDQSVPVKKIIVVIDHNPALLARLQLQLQGTAIKLVENVEERGLSGARNSGIAVSEGEILAFLDDDAIAAPDWLEKLSEGYNQPQVMGVGGAIEPLWHNGRPAWFPAEFDWVVGCTYLGMPTTIKPVRNLIGCNMSFRRTVFEEAGGFRSGIGRVGKRPVGCEETELCIRASQKWPQKIFLYDPDARVQHRLPASRARWNYFRSRCYAEGLSKALISHYVGTKDGLGSERNYTLKVLPRGMRKGLLDTLLRLDKTGLLRSSAIIAGFVITTTGYFKGKIHQPTSILQLDNILFNQLYSPITK